MKARQSTSTSTSNASGSSSSASETSTDHGNAANAEDMGATQDPEACAHDHDHDHGQEPEPGSGLSETELDAQRPVGDAIPADLRGRLMDGLRAAPASQSTLDTIEGARGDLDFEIKWSNRGNYHSRGRIYLDRNRDEAKWLSSMMHELVHLATYLEGNAADVNTMDRDEFVAEKMRDEIDAQATAYVSLLQTGVESDGSAGYNEFRAELVADNQELLTNESWTEIKALAVTWITEKYQNEWQTSNSGENYYEYWGQPLGLASRRLR